ncbi:hypothetical protein SAMN05519103_04892 [Rhizobiales bacterium GAS113]|jgi:outer membrane lipoprotein SlyB|nr:hypothetical protein SAMN05519103_04892 [Rhizobiales bacterium GAS113]
MRIPVMIIALTAAVSFAAPAMATERGAVGGAVVGGTAGAIVGGPVGAVVGAGAGAVVGGGVTGHRYSHRYGYHRYGYHRYGARHYHSYRG